ncbi:hypothetical protein [Lunatibacter salilacus]|uniref:hypothetical protein n=1 Tax=Lunatibacter salilacus TaxID=2483804 RepID=UPI00131D0424|nr:hypothetical protein [Lunatibacter salilacus]
MKASLFNLSAGAILAAFLFASCSGDDGSESAEASLTCKIDGVAFTAVSFENTLTGDDRGKQFDIRATDASGIQLVIGFNDFEPYGTNFSYIGDTLYVDMFENEPASVGTIGMMIDTDFSISVPTFDGKESGYSMVKSSDLSTRRISGIFEFDLVNPQNNETVRITDGVYTNLTYGSANL